MRIEIEIPKEFECDYNKDKFDEFFGRVLAEIIYSDGCCGNYEEETAKMLQRAFAESKVAYDVEAVVAELEKYMKASEKDYALFQLISALGEMRAFEKAIEIVRGKE
jgi:hypothetical protein